MKIGKIKMRKKVGTSTYIQRINTLERKLLKQVKELDDVMEKHPEIMFRLQVVEENVLTCQDQFRDCSKINFSVKIKYTKSKNGVLV
jgi:hypothetical protein